MTCTLLVDGVVQDVATFSGTGVVAGIDDTDYLPFDASTTTLCTTVDVTDREMPAFTECRDAVLLTGHVEVAPGL